MKITKLLCCLLLVSTTAFCQKSEFHVNIAKKIVGKNLINDTYIEGVEYIFQDKIHEYFIDSTMNYLTVQLRDFNTGGKKQNTAGNILQYDLKDQKILWDQKMDYQTCELQKFGKFLIFNDQTDSYGIDIQTGNYFWKGKTSVYHASPERNIYLAYKRLNSKEYAQLSEEITNELSCFDFFNNNKIWSRNINREYGWNDVFYLNDSTLMVVAAGLHSMNIYTGEGWDYRTITGKKMSSISTNEGAAMMGIMFGLIGALIYAAATNNDPITTNEDVIRDVVSNTLIDNEFIYFASMEQIVKLDKHSGEIIWKFPLKNKMTSQSSIFLDDNIVYMINKGFASRGINQISFGNAFITAFDKQSGKQKYFTLLKDGVIINYKQIDKYVYVLFQTRVVKFDLETGTFISKKIYPTDSFKELKNFTNNQNYFILNNGDVFNPDQSDSTNLHFNTNQRKILSVDKQLNIKNTIEYKDIAISLCTFNNHNFLSTDKKTYVINDDGKIIAELEVTSNAFIVNDILYDKREKSFIAIDLKNLCY